MQATKDIKNTSSNNYKQIYINQNLILRCSGFVAKIRSTLHRENKTFLFSAMTPKMKASDPKKATERASLSVEFVAIALARYINN